MHKNLLYGMMLIGLCVVVLVVNRGSVSVDLLFTQLSAAKSFIFLGFIGAGVLIGVLLK